jgi:hypothetical protein
MLSEQEYEKTKWQLDHIPTCIEGTERRNLRATLKRKIHEHELITTFPPFQPLPFSSHFINRTTDEEILYKLIQAATTATEFTLDTESVNVYKKRNEPVLIQLQILHPSSASIVIITECCFLPNENHNRFRLIQEFFKTILSEEKQIYIWGTTAELFPFIKFKLFTYEQIDGINFINLQNNFKTYWDKQHIHGINNGNNRCSCTKCLGKNPSELWSLQDATAVELNEYLSKIYSKQNFNIGLDPNIFHTQNHNNTHRNKLTTYALHDCLSMERIINGMKINNFNFVSSRKNYQIMSMDFSTDEDNDDELIYTLTPSITHPIINQQLNHQSEESEEEEQLISNNSTRNCSNWRMNTTNHSNRTINRHLTETNREAEAGTNYEAEDPTYNEDHDELTAEEKRKIRNKHNTTKQRNRNYRNTLYIKNIDKRFSIRSIKEILKYKNISFFSVNTPTSRITKQMTLKIAVRDPTKLREYRRITKNLFSTEHYEAMGRMKRRIHQGYHHPTNNNKLDQQRRHRR